jgi:hypothetical protein
LTVPPNYLEQIQAALHSGSFDSLVAINLAAAKVLEKRKKKAPEPPPKPPGRKLNLSPAPAAPRSESAPYVDEFMRRKKGRA